MSTILSGASFGAALVAAGMYQPAVILGQLKFENFQMLQTFLAAAASSTLFVTALDSLGYVKAKPRSPSQLGLFSQYDGNIIGGSLLGLGMALAGSCPGTVLAQVGVGTPSGIYALTGAVAAGILWSGLLKGWVKSNSAGAQRRENPKETIHEQAGISKAVAFMGIEIAFVGVIYAILQLAPTSRSAVLPPVLGGLFIGLAQLLSMVLRRSMLGVSTSYEELGNYFWWLVKGAKEQSQPTSYANLLFSASAVSGAWALSSNFPSFAAGGLESPVSSSMALTGGLFIGLGSRIAGGCTSGHGISGISLFSTSSFVTILFMFSAAALAAPVFY